MSKIHDDASKLDLPECQEDRRRILNRERTRRYREDNAGRLEEERLSDAARAERKAMRAEKKDHINAIKRAWYEKNRDRILASKKPKTDEQLAHDRERASRWYAENQDQAKAYREKTKERARQYRQDTKEHRSAFNRANSLKRKYGLTVEQVAAMIEAQNGVCKCCLTAFGLLRGHRPCVDHCHRTGKVRGILCDRCNLLVGHSGDSPDTLRNAANYLDGAGA